MSPKLKSLPPDLRQAADELIAARFPTPYTHTFTNAEPADVATWILKDFKDFNFIGIDYGLEDSSWVEQVYRRREYADNYFKAEYLGDWKRIVNTAAV